MSVLFTNKRFEQYMTSRTQLFVQMTLKLFVSKMTRRRFRREVKSLLKTVLIRSASIGRQMSSPKSQLRCLLVRFVRGLRSVAVFMTAPEDNVIRQSIGAEITRFSRVLGINNNPEEPSGSTDPTEPANDTKEFGFDYVYNDMLNWYKLLEEFLDTNTDDTAVELLGETRQAMTDFKESEFYKQKIDEGTPSRRSDASGELQISPQQTSHESSAPSEAASTVAPITTESDSSRSETTSDTTTESDESPPEKKKKDSSSDLSR